MSPFAGYPDFDACVADNSDKSDPNAFCAWLHHEATGSWPGEMTLGLPAKVKEKFWESFGSFMASQKDGEKAMKSAETAVSELGWVRMKHGWARKAEHKLETKAVLGIPVFAAGVHNGDKYTEDDLKDMVSAFKALKGRLDPPVKIGHTSDEFNKKLAKKMGVEPELLKGEGGNGVMAFGWIEDLRVQGKMLYADLTDVPEPVAELIESKSYNQVSAEVIFDFKDKGKTYPRVLCGLALLGAELPAVRETGLETAAVYTQANEPDSVIEFSLDLEEVTFAQLEPALSDVDEAIERVMKGRAGVTTIRAMWKEVKAKVKKMFETRKHKLEDIPPEVQAYADANFAGNVDSLIEWAGSAGFRGCVSSLSGKEGVSDPERLCGWLKAQASERGLLSLEHGKFEYGEEVEMSKEILKELGLDEKAKEEEVIAAIKKLKTGEELKSLFKALGLDETISIADAVKAVGELKSQTKAGDAEVKQFADRIAQLEKDNRGLKRENRKAHYKGIAGELKAISGTPDELAEELTALEEKAGEDVVEKILGRYQDQNKRLIAAGIFKAKGTPAAGDEEDDHEFVKDIKKYMQEKHVDEPTAQAALRREKPEVWRDYMAKRRVVTRPVEGSED